MYNFVLPLLGLILSSTTAIAGDTISTFQNDMTDLINQHSGEAYTLTTSSSNGDTAITFITADGNSVSNKTYYFTPSDDERALLTQLAATGNTFLREAEDGEPALFDINGVGYTIDTDSLNQLSGGMSSLEETTSPSATSLAINGKYYNISPRSYDNAETINPTSYEAGKIATKYFQWDESNNHIILTETDETSDSNVAVTYITNPKHNRQKADLEGADLIGFNFYNQSNSNETGGAINNQNGYSE